MLRTIIEMFKSGGEKEIKASWPSEARNCFTQCQVFLIFFSSFHSGIKMLNIFFSNNALGQGELNSNKRWKLPLWWYRQEFQSYFHPRLSVYKPRLDLNSSPGSHFCQFSVLESYCLRSVKIPTLSPVIRHRVFPLFFLLKLPASPCHGSFPLFFFESGDDQLLQQSKPRDQSEPTQATNPTSLLAVLNLKSQPGCCHQSGHELQ